MPDPLRLILLADDDANTRNLVRQMLEKKGFSVLAAEDGDAALALSRSHEGAIDLLLTDIEMPHRDGISLYRQILKERPYIQVIFMSGALPRRLKIELPEFLTFIPKPFEPHALLDSVNELLTKAPPIIDDVKVILVVDGDEERSRRTSKILTDNGYWVTVADSAEEAEIFVDSVQQIDLIISAVVLPHASGVSLAEHSDASGRGISTLLVSHFNPALLRNIKGFSQQHEFLSNPFSPEALLTRVRRLLSS
jgi:DNA-binding response OmpR family regulator